MTAGDVLIELVARGAILWVHDGRLRFGAPEGAVDAELRAAAGGVRAELLGLIQDGAVLPADRAAWDPEAVHDIEERAAIIEFDGGIHSAEAEDLAVRLVRVAWTRAYLRRRCPGAAVHLPNADPVDRPAVAVATFPGREAARTG